MELTKREASGKAMSGNSCNSYKDETSFLVIAATQDKSKG
jgi:hypothetical protein